MSIRRVIRKAGLFKRTGAMAAVVVVSAIVSASGAQGASTDAEKAAFLHRFAAFVEWPDGTPNDPFVIAVAGADGIVKQLETLLPRMTVRGHAAVVRRVARGADLLGANILFVGKGELARTRALRTTAIEKPILIVTDDPDGLDGGAIINFLQDDRSVRFEISLIAADRAQLKIDASLLAVAAKVERRPQVVTPGADETTP